MSKNLKTKVAAGAALVALSGFVPQPLMQQANAATATINATGSFISGVALAGGQALQFGTIVATQTTGNVQITVGGAAANTNNALMLGAPQQGLFTYTLAITGSLRLSITQGIGAVAGPAPGTVQLNRVTFSSANVNGGNTFQFAATGAIQTHSFGDTGPANNLNMGGRIAWNGGRPIGAFTQTVGLFMAF